MGTCGCGVILKRECEPKGILGGEGKRGREWLGGGEAMAELSSAIHEDTITIAKQQHSKPREIRRLFYYYSRIGSKAYLLDSPPGFPFPETVAFPLSRVHVPAASPSVENDRARKVQNCMSEAIVKRIAFGKMVIVGVSSIVGFVLLVGSTVRNTSKGNVVLGRRGCPCYPARDHCNSLGGNDWKALEACAQYNNGFDSRPGRVGLSEEEPTDG